MKSLVFYHPSGEIYRVRSGSDASIEAQKAIETDAYIETDQSVDVDRYYVADGAVVQKPTKPDEDHAFDYDQGQWFFDLSLARNAKWLEIKAAREAQEFGTFDWGGYTFQCDEVSQRRIQGAVQLAGLDPTLVMDWTLADNSVQSFTASDFIAIGQALAQHVNAGHVKSRGLRSQIEAATTEAEISAITW